MFTTQTLRLLLSAALSAVESNVDHLNALDGATGDGDHGTAIHAAMKAAVGAAATTGSLAEVLSAIGWAVMSEASGSTSTLTGSFYAGMSESAPSDSLSPDEMITMFESGLNHLRQTTKAGVGDRTLMDALIPAIGAMSLLKGTGASFQTLYAAAAEAAKRGAESTKTLVAKFGRAKNLGERVLGHEDAGAASTAIIYEAFSQSSRSRDFQELLLEKS